MPIGPRATTQPVHTVKEHPVREQAPVVLVYVEGKARHLAFEQLVTQALKHVPHANPPAMHPAPAAHVLLCVPAAGKHHIAFASLIFSCVIYMVAPMFCWTNATQAFSNQ